MQKCWCSFNLNFLGVKRKTTLPPTLKTNHMQQKKSSNPEIRKSPRTEDWTVRVYNLKEERFTEEFTDTSLVPWICSDFSGKNRRVGVGKLEWIPLQKKGRRLEKDERLFVHMFVFFKLGDVKWCWVMVIFLKVSWCICKLYWFGVCVLIERSVLTIASPLDPKYTHRILWNTGGGGAGRAFKYILKLS